MKTPMTPPTPTEADKRAAEEIVLFLDPGWRRVDAPDPVEIAKFIAEAHQPEREALRLAKEAMLLYTRSFSTGFPSNNVIVAAQNRALAAIEKVSQ